MTGIEEYRRQIIGAQSKSAGDLFEQQINSSLLWYENNNVLNVKKTPEPMKPIKPLGNKGQFIAHYEKKAQVDYSGTMIGGRAIRFEAKQTDTGRFTRNRLSKEQMDDLRGHSKFGALCFVMLCFGINHFYRIPWEVWDNMKQIYGRQYIEEKDIQEYRIPQKNGIIGILYRIQAEANETEPNK